MKQLGNLATKAFGTGYLHENEEGDVHKFCKNRLKKGAVWLQVQKHTRSHTHSRRHAQQMACTASNKHHCWIPESKGRLSRCNDQVSRKVVIVFKAISLRKPCSTCSHLHKPQMGRMSALPPRITPNLSYTVTKKGSEIRLV